MIHIMLPIVLFVFLKSSHLEFFDILSECPACFRLAVTCVCVIFSLLAVVVLRQIGL